MFSEDIIANQFFFWCPHTMDNMPHTYSTHTVHVLLQSINRRQARRARAVSSSEWGRGNAEFPETQTRYSLNINMQGRGQAELPLELPPVLQQCNDLLNVQQQLCSRFHQQVASL